jgi:YgiT-type zinc finger domain-containing protein
MTCPTCQTGHTARGTATRTLERDETIIVVRHVPADVCDRCGAPFYAGAVVEQLLALLDEATGAGARLQVREFTLRETLT